MTHLHTRSAALFLIGCCTLASGCQSPYRSDQGALAGGLAGAGLGAIVGNAVGNTGAGAAIGAGVGALSGAAIGGSLDEIEARNRMEIEARMGAMAPKGSVTIDDVVAMTRANVSEEVIATHVRNHGVAAPLQASDLIVLQQQGVSSRVIQAMQAPPAAAQPVGYVAAPPAVIVEERYVAPAYYYPPPYYRRPGMHWGVSVAH